ncbi:MAG: ABC transporter ATP-binding protein [Gemmatimonadales bacterium]
MISVSALSKHFHGRVAVERISFEVPAGRVCVLLGPNGAGKTTTMRMLLGLLTPTEGSAVVAGVRLPAARDAATALRRRAGLLTETPGFYDRQTGAENLDFFGRLYGLDHTVRARSIERWLRQLELWDARDRPFGEYSKGMKQRLALIRAVLHEPDVIFLDEPTAGLDPAAARDVRDLIGELRRQGRTVLLSTHHLGEAQTLADLIGILQGRLLAFGTLDELAGYAAALEVRLADEAERLAAVARAVPGVSQVSQTGLLLRVETADLEDTTPRLVAALVAGGAAIREVRPVRASLEEIYLRAIETEP